jgi:hypothetical protein
MKMKVYGMKERGGKAETFYYERNVGGNDVRVKIIYCATERGDTQFMGNDWGDTKFAINYKFSQRTLRLSFLIQKRTLSLN